MRNAFATNWVCGESRLRDKGHFPVEIKCVEKMLPIHEAQLLTYLKLSGLQVGLIINFHAPTLKDGIKRLAL